MIDGRKKVAFICVHNSCRSQIAEALGKHLASDVFESYSAGSETKPQINQDAVRLMKELYGIDMEQSQYSKTFDSIPEPDIAISMGCDVGCPYIGRAFDDNWGLNDPTGSAGICPCLHPDGYSDLGNDISHDAESGLQQCTKCRKKSEGVVCDMDCQLAYKTFYNVWHCQLVFLRDFQGIYYA